MVLAPSDIHLGAGPATTDGPKFRNSPRQRWPELESAYGVPRRYPGMAADRRQKPRLSRPQAFLSLRASDIQTTAATWFTGASASRHLLRYPAFAGPRQRQRRDTDTFRLLTGSNCRLLVWHRESPAWTRVHRRRGSSTCDTAPYLAQSHRQQRQADPGRPLACVDPCAGQLMEVIDDVPSAPLDIPAGRRALPGHQADLKAAPPATGFRTRTPGSRRLRG